MGKVVAIIAARMQSTRLPGKALLDIAGRPMLARVIERVQRAKTVDAIVVATTERAEDQAICNLATDMGVSCYAGSVDDVLDRYYQAAMFLRADVIVRITGDCPLLQPSIVDAVVNGLIVHGYDYFGNIAPASFPDGLDCEALTFETLKTAQKEATLPSDREHVSPYMRRNGRFVTGNLERKPSLAHLRWCVDEQADLDFVRAVYAEMGRDDFGMADVLALLDRKPELAKINGHLKRNASYLAQVEGERQTSYGRGSRKDATGSREEEARART